MNKQRTKIKKSGIENTFTELNYNQYHDIENWIRWTNPWVIHERDKDDKSNR